MFVIEGIRKGFLPSRGKRDRGERERVMERRERRGDGNGEKERKQERGGGEGGSKMRGGDE